jgi:ribosomal protein S18 acetylase RimI-like enzyme
MINKKDNILYRRAVFDDLESITIIHLQSFPNFFLTKMGFAFVREYYRILLHFPESIAILSEEAGQPVGFIVGFGNPKKFYEFYGSQKKQLLFLTIVAVASNPLLVTKVINNFRRISQVESLKSDVEISSLAVLPGLQNSGIGRLLLTTFLESVKEARIYTKVFLTTDSMNNDSVNNFYQKQGFNMEKTFWRGDRKMNLYTKAM